MHTVYTERRVGLAIIAVLLALVVWLALPRPATDTQVCEWTIERWSIADAEPPTLVECLADIERADARRGQ